MGARLAALAPLVEPDELLFVRRNQPAVEQKQQMFHKSLHLTLRKHCNDCKFRQRFLFLRTHLVGCCVATTMADITVVSDSPIGHNISICHYKQA